MDTKLIQILKDKYENIDVEELLKIYKGNDQYNYSTEAFEAIKIILKEKNIDLPIQNAPIIKKAEVTYGPTYLKQRKNGYIGMSLGLAVIILTKLIVPDFEFSQIGLFIIGGFLWYWGFYNYAKRKGYRGTYTIIGALGLLGLLIMFLREDRNGIKNV